MWSSHTPRLGETMPTRNGWVHYQRGDLTSIETDLGGSRPQSVLPAIRVREGLGLDD